MDRAAKNKDDPKNQTANNEAMAAVKKVEAVEDAIRRIKYRIERAGTPSDPFKTTVGKNTTWIDAYKTGLIESIDIVESSMAEAEKAEA